MILVQQLYSIFNNYGTEIDIATKRCHLVPVWVCEAFVAEAIFKTKKCHCEAFFAEAIFNTNGEDCFVAQTAPRNDTAYTIPSHLIQE